MLDFDMPRDARRARDFPRRGLIISALEDADREKRHRVAFAK